MKTNINKQNSQTNLINGSPLISSNSQLILPNIELLTIDTPQPKNKNTLNPLPKPSIDLFEYIGKTDKFHEYFDDNYFAEILLLLLPSISNSSILFFQKNFNSLILSKDDFTFINEYLISINKEPYNLNKIHASLGSLHYIYLLYYDWLISFKSNDNINNYKPITLNFFDMYLSTINIISKYNLSQQIKYTTNFFHQRTKAYDIFIDIINIGNYIKSFVDSGFTVNSHLFKIKFEAYEEEYIKLVKKFILEGKTELGHNENYKITEDQIQKISQSLSFDTLPIQDNKGLWIHKNDINIFLGYIKRYELLKNIHKSYEQDLNDNEDGQDSGDAGNGENGGISNTNIKNGNITNTSIPNNKSQNKSSSRKKI